MMIMEELIVVQDEFVVRRGRMVGIFSWITYPPSSFAIGYTAREFTLAIRFAGKLRGADAILLD